MIRICLSFLFLLVCIQVQGQSISVTGKLIDQETGDALPGAVIGIYKQGDSSLVSQEISSEEGTFLFKNIPHGAFFLSTGMLGFERVEKSFIVDGSSVDLKNISLKSSVHSLKGVDIEAVQSRVEQKGDTSQFNAAAYKVTKDASAEDLVTKLPGVVNDNGTLKINGEEVKRITVDGKSFFGDDPMAALKNLPAEVIDKVQSFDRLSDQAQFTGFDDGQGTRSLNIITKPGKNTGQFGKFYAGYGTDERFSTGGNLNFFNKITRITLVGMSNNINQQNFSTEDMQALNGTSNQGSRGRAGGFKWVRPGSNAFMTNEQGGITKTNSIGINFSTQYKSSIKLSGSYFLNNTDNENITNTLRSYVSSSDSGLTYREISNTDKINTNHKGVFKMEIEIDSANSILITPRVTLSSTKTNTVLEGGTLTNEQIYITRIFNDNFTNAKLNSISNNVMYKHSFLKRGRTVSLNFANEYNDRLSISDQMTENRFFYPVDDSLFFTQNMRQNTLERTYSSGLVYTEPVSLQSLIQISYQPSFSTNTSDKETEIKPSGSNDFMIDSTLSNRFNNTFNTHISRLNYRWSRGKDFNVMFGAGHQYSELRGIQTFPVENNTFKVFNNFVPEAMLNFKFDSINNLRVRYRTSVNAPSISELQNVVDNSNPLLLKTGNPDLKQEYSHMVFSRLGRTNPKNSRSVFVFLHGSITNNYVGNSTFIANTDTMVKNIFLRRGAQLTMPVNLNGMMNARSFFTYSLPVKLIKSNVHFTSSLTFSRLPGLINDKLNNALSYGINEGITITSNISEDVDFTLSYNGTYTIVNNSLQQQNNYNYFQQISSGKIDWRLFNDLIITSSVTHTLYAGLSEGFNPAFILWNGGIGYKLLKSKMLDARITVFDILNQNTGISRTVSETYVEDVSTNILNRYFMVVLTYNLRRFNVSEKKPGHSTN